MKRNVRPSANMCLTLDHTPFDDAYMIKYRYSDDHGDTIRLKCDATKMDFKGRKKAGLARYAVIHPRLYNVKFVKKGTSTWGITVRDGLVIKPGEEIFRRF
jgi:hypothetical protein